MRLRQANDVEPFATHPRNWSHNRRPVVQAAEVRHYIGCIGLETAAIFVGMKRAAELPLAGTVESQHSLHSHTTGQLIAVIVMSRGAVTFLRLGIPDDSPLLDNNNNNNKYPTQAEFCSLVADFLETCATLCRGSSLCLYPRPPLQALN